MGQARTLVPLLGPALPCTDPEIPSSALQSPGRAPLTASLILLLAGSLLQAGRTWAWLLGQCHLRALLQCLWSGEGTQVRFGVSVLTRFSIPSGNGALIPEGDSCRAQCAVAVKVTGPIHSRLLPQLRGPLATLRAVASLPHSLAQVSWPLPEPGAQGPLYTTFPGPDPQ